MKMRRTWMYALLEAEETPDEPARMAGSKRLETGRKPAIAITIAI